MGSCECVKVPAPTDILDKYWKSLPIRQKTVKDTVQMIKAKKNIADEDLNEKKLNMIIESLLMSPKYKEPSYKIFRKAHKLSISEYPSENYFLLSLLFLCKNDSVPEFMEGFIELYNYFESLGNIENLNENKPSLIKTDILDNIIKYYVNLVTLLPVDDLGDIEGSEFNNNKNILNEDFSKEKQNKYIEGMIMQGFLDKGEVDLMEFFNTNLDKLVRDFEIRGFIIGFNDSDNKYEHKNSFSKAKSNENYENREN